MAILRIPTESQNGVPQDFLPQGGSTWSNWCAKVKKNPKKVCKLYVRCGLKMAVFTTFFALMSRWLGPWPQNLLVEVWIYQGICPSWKSSIIWKQVTPILTFFMISGVNHERIREENELRLQLAYSSFACKSSWILITSLDLWLITKIIRLNCNLHTKIVNK